MSQDDITIVIADDQPIYMQGLREILEREADFRIIGAFHDGESALECVRRERPHIAIVGGEMQALSGLDVAAIVQRDRIPSGIIILAATDALEVFGRAIDYGAAGYVLKDTAADGLVRGIRDILIGKYYYSPSLATRMVLQRMNPGAPSQIVPALIALTMTERKVLRFIGESKSSSDIAAIMSISLRTVEKHRSNISRKLDLHGPYALVRFAFQNLQLL